MQGSCAGVIRPAHGLILYSLVIWWMRRRLTFQKQPTLFTSTYIPGYLYTHLKQGRDTVMLLPWLLSNLPWLLSIAVASSLPAWIAHSKGHSFWTWWLYAVLLWPIAFIHSIIKATDLNGLEKRQLANGFQKCPACAELIKAGAVICKHCGQEQTQSIETNNYEMSHKGHPIIEIPGGYKTMGAWFESAEQAKRYIDNNTN